jgi:hypothetical protein
MTHSRRPRKTLLRHSCAALLLAAALACAPAAALAQCALLSGPGPTPWPACATWTGGPTWTAYVPANQQGTQVELVLSAAEFNGDGLSDMFFIPSSATQGMAFATSNGTEDSRRAALMTAAARRRESRG